MCICSIFLFLTAKHPHSLNQMISKQSFTQGSVIFFYLQSPLHISILMTVYKTLPKKPYCKLYLFSIAFDRKGPLCKNIYSCGNKNGKRCCKFHRIDIYELNTVIYFNEIHFPIANQDASLNMYKKLKKKIIKYVIQKHSIPFKQIKACTLSISKLYVIILYLLKYLPVCCLC